MNTNTFPGNDELPWPKSGGDWYFPQRKTQPETERDNCHQMQMKYKIQNRKYKIQNTKYKIQNTKYNTLAAGWCCCKWFYDDHSDRDITFMMTRIALVIIMIKVIIIVSHTFQDNPSWWIQIIVQFNEIFFWDRTNLKLIESHSSSTKSIIESKLDFVSVHTFQMNKKFQRHVFNC